ncbi:hypothetical protein Tco_0218507 [Tanacetum coccineum]
MTKNGKSDRKYFRCGDPNYLIGECPKSPKDKNQRAFIGGSWSDNGEEDDEKVKDGNCIVAHSIKYALDVLTWSPERINQDSGLLPKHMTRGEPKALLHCTRPTMDDMGSYSAKPKEKGDVVIDPVAPVSTATRTTVTILTPRKGIVITEKITPTRTRSQQLPSKDKGKGKVEEIEKPIKRKDHIRHDEEVAQRL